MCFASCNRSQGVLCCAEQLPTGEGDLFHAIHVGAAAASIPQALEGLLAPGGRLVIPVGAPHNTYPPAGRPREQVWSCS